MKMKEENKWLISSTIIVVLLFVIIGHIAVSFDEKMKFENNQELKISNSYKQLSEDYWNLSVKYKKLNDSYNSLLKENVNSFEIENIDYNNLSNEILIKNQDCKGSLKQVSNCLVNNVEPYYKYLLVKDGRRLDFEKMLREGSDCEYWAKYYKQELSKHGFKSKLVETIPINRKNHVFLVVSDEEMYCLLDQRIVECWRFN